MTILLPASNHGNGHSKWARKLSLFEQSPWDTGLLAKAAEVRGLAACFDYFHVRSVNYYTEIANGTTVLNQTTLQNEMNTFSGGNYGAMKFIFQMLSPYAPGLPGYPSYSNDTHWTNIASNFAKIGAVLSPNPLFDGIFWDWEWYAGTNYWFNDDEATGLSGTHAQKCALVQSRFKQLMNGLLSTWPDVQFTTTHGPSNSMTSAYNWLTTDGFTLTFNDVSQYNDLMASAFIGMMEAVYDAGNIATLYDGGTAYAMRSQADARRLQVWQQALIKTNPNPGSGTYDSTLFSNGGMPAKYRPQACLGLFDININPSQPDGVAVGQKIPPTAWQNMIASAMRQANGLVWCYTETWDWIIRPWKDPITQAMLDATAEGRRLGRL